MKFRWINKQGVECDSGFIIQRTGRFTYEYREGMKIMVLPGESMFSGLGSAEFGFSFDPAWRTAGWNPPHDQVLISSSKRHELIKNINQAFDYMNGKAEFR